MAFEIEVDPHSLDRSARGAVTGIIFVQADDIAYPERGWNDFPVVVLGWWLREVTGLLSGSTEASCMFMDGPFAFRLAERNKQWLLQATGPDEVTLELDMLVSPRDVVDSLLRASKGIERECEHRKWTSADIDELRKWHDAMQTAVTR